MDKYRAEQFGSLQNARQTFEDQLKQLSKSVGLAELRAGLLLSELHFTAADAELVARAQALKDYFEDISDRFEPNLGEVDREKIIVRLPRDLIEALDDYLVHQVEPPTRPEAIRRLVAIALKKEAACYL